MTVPPRTRNDGGCSTPPARGDGMPGGDTAARIAALSPEQRAMLDERARELGLAHLLRPASQTASAPRQAADVGSLERRTARRTGPSFSLFFFSDNGSAVGTGKYDLLMRGAAFADQHGFSAVWTPERHFHRFGGLYPNPAILGAALATATTNVGIRAGSVVLPLHHPARIAEEWSVVDNLSGGRVGVAFASGWRPRTSCWQVPRTRDGQTSPPKRSPSCARCGAVTRCRSRRRRNTPRSANLPAPGPARAALLVGCRGQPRKLETRRPDGDERPHDAGNADRLRTRREDRRLRCKPRGTRASPRATHGNRGAARSHWRERQCRPRQRA